MTAALQFAADQLKGSSRRILIPLLYRGRHFLQSRFHELSTPTSAAIGILFLTPPSTFARAFPSLHEVKSENIISTPALAIL